MVAQRAEVRGPGRPPRRRQGNAKMPEDIVFFATAAAFRAWLEKHHATADEQWVGFYKVATGKPSISWQESVDEALCFGWIDGLRKKIDDEAYKIRFTPRRPQSKWSAKNIASVENLVAAGRMRPAGMEAYEKRRDDRSGTYSYEQRDAAKLTGEYEQRMRENPAAWEFFQRQAPWYRRTAAFWVISAKKEVTRLRRLDTLIAESAAGRAIGPLRRRKDGP
jgi:uncharacterized protein YdeI (YjbR/CyaY-like superfamily)